MRAEIERHGKRALNCSQALQQIVSDAGKQELVAVRTGCHTIAAPGQQPPVKDVVVGVHGLRVVFRWLAYNEAGARHSPA